MASGNVTWTHSYNFVANTNFTTKGGWSESGGVNGGNPQFKAAFTNCITNACDFHIGSTSAAKDKGTTLSGFATDRGGVTRPQGSAWDIGAYEYPAGGSTSDTTAPSNPTNLAASAVSTSQINLSWSASTDNVGVTGYRLERCSGANCSNFAEIATPGGTSYSNTGLAAGTTYGYRVRAVDAAGNPSSYSSVASATAPNQTTTDTAAPSNPTNLAASAVSTSQINLSWSASTDNVGVTGYRLERCSGANCTNFAQIATPGGTSYSNTGLTAGTTYRYRVRAVDLAGNLSSYSSVASATTKQQTTASEETIWGSRSTTGFTGDLQPWDLGMVFIPTVAGQVTGVRVYGVANESGDHTARLWRNSDNKLLSGPHTITFSGSGWHEFSLPTPVPLSANQAYTVTVSTGEDSTRWYSEVTQDPAMGKGGSNGLHITYPANASVYSETIGVRPTKSWQQSNYLRDVIFVAQSSTADTTAPSVPANLQATAVSTSQIDLMWTASTDNVGVTGYRVDRCEGANCTNFTQIATQGGTSYTDSGLSANTTCRYRIRATDAAGNLSSYSDIASATTQVDSLGGITDGNVYYPLEVAAGADGDWTPVDASSGFADAVVLAGPPSFNDADPGVVRLANVDNLGFELRFQEWDYRQRLGDTTHALESIPYLVLEPGRHVMSDGSIWEVGTFSIGGSKSWKSVQFSQSFGSAPYLFLTVQTANDPEAVTVRARSVGAAGFEVALFEEEALNNGHGVETVGYLAIKSDGGGGVLDIGGDRVPYLLQSLSAGDKWTPVLSQRLMVEEEQSKDNEVKHADETLHVLAFGQKLFAQQVSNNGGDTTALRRMPPSEDAPMEWGLIRGVADSWKTLPLAKTYANPVVVAKPVSQHGAEPGVIRLREIGPDRFDLRYQEWGYLDGKHTSTEDLFYMVAEAGQHTLGGLEVEAALIETDKLALDGEWESVAFINGFFDVPVVLAGVQTENGGYVVTTRITDLHAAGFDLAMDEQEARNDGHVTETLGWIAIEAGTGITADGRKVQSFFADIGDALTSVSYLESTTHRYPTIVADIDSTFDADPGFLRFDVPSGTAIKLKIAEEASADAETAHSPETVGIFVGE